MSTTTTLDSKLSALNNILSTSFENPETIRQAAQKYGTTAKDLSNITGIPVEQIHSYFLNAGVPLGTVLTGDVQRTFGSEGNIRQIDKGEDVTVEKVIGRQGDKLVVQRYDAYGTPTTTRLADPNTSEGKGWLQALGVVGGAIGLSSLPEISSLFGGTEAATVAGSALPAASTLTGTVAGLAPETLAALEATGLTNIPGIVGTTGGLLEAGLAAGAAGTLANAANTTKSLTDAAKVASAASSVVNALSNPGASSLLGNLIGSGANLAMVNDAADKLRAQGQISQEQYNQLSQELENKYTAAGQAAQQGLLGVGERAAGMVGNFTPYGVTNQLFGTRFNPTTGTVETTLSGQGSQLYDPFSRVAAQSAKAAEMTNVDQLSTDYYNKLAALSAPETERQRLATEERLRAQGRLGVTGSAFGGTSPELLAQEQAIARQQLERELQSRQAALAERGTLIGQGVSAYSPISNLLTQQGQQQQLSGQLGQMSQAGRIAAGQLFAQPATQAYVQPLQFYGQGLQQVGQTERLGIASNLAAQQAALDAQAVGRTNVANQLLGQNGSNIGNLLSSGVNFFTNPNAAGNLNTLGFGTGLGYGNQDIGLFI